MDQTESGRRTAILFRTHFWDDFAQRQFDRLKPTAEGHDLYVLVDETNGPVTVPHDRVLRVTEAELVDMGLARAGTGNLLWFNGDYPLYRFIEMHGEYDYVLQLEYDVVTNFSLTDMIRQAASRGVDYVGLTKGEDTPHWPWVDTCADVYTLSEIRHQLICLSLFSRRALQLLWRRRLELSRAFTDGQISAWPMCEAFIATELEQAGMICRELSDYGDTSRYDHWPPYLEADIGQAKEKVFVHPVLDEERYVSSLLKYKIGLGGYLNPLSLYHRKLRRLRTSRYLSALAASFTAKSVRTLRQAAARAAGVLRFSPREVTQP